MDDTKLVAIGDFPNRIDADIAHGALEAADISSFVSADDAGAVQPGLWMRGIKLFVREEDAVRAREILNL